MMTDEARAKIRASIAQVVSLDAIKPALWARTHDGAVTSEEIITMVNEERALRAKEGM